MGVIAGMDKPLSPAGEAKQAFYNHLFGRTLAHRMAFRKRVLATTVSDLQAVATRYFDPNKASIGLITNRDTLGSISTEDFNIINL